VPEEPETERQKALPGFKEKWSMFEELSRCLIASALHTQYAEFRYRHIATVPHTN
jgi:hypothetical protein